MLTGYEELEEHSKEENTAEQNLSIQNTIKG
jgi:hypothetical protein